MYQGRQEQQQAQFKNKPGVQLPPIDRKGTKQNSRQNAKQEVQQPEDKYEQMRNRSRNNADRLQKLREIKNQYTNLKGKKNEKMARVKSENAQGINVLNGNNNDGEKYDFEVFEIEKVRKNSENITNLIGGNNTEANINTEKEIEDLERELALLKSDIKNQEESIAELDKIKQQISQNEKSPENQPQQQQQPDLKDMVFGQRVKGKDMNDYWNSNDIKTTFKVQQNPGGFSQVKIGDDYDFFKDKENANYIQSKLGKNYYSPKNNQNIASYAGNLDQSIQISQQFKKNNENNSYNQSQISSSKKPHPNEQSYNIINHSNYNEQGEKEKNQYSKQQQQQLYSQQLREQISQNNSNVQNTKQNQQSINIFQGYPSQNINQSNKNASAFISSLLYQQEKEQQNQQRIPNHQSQLKNNNQNLSKIQNYNQQLNQQYLAGNDISADGKKIVRISQPPGGRSQIMFN